MSLAPKDCRHADEIAQLRQQIARLRGERDHLLALINSPHTDDWLTNVRTEAAHQRLRYPEDHDANKTPFDWFWLIGYLAQKAAAAAVACDREKALHHTISTGAALLNWHRHIDVAVTAPAVLAVERVMDLPAPT